MLLPLLETWFRLWCADSGCCRQPAREAYMSTDRIACPGTCAAGPTWITPPITSELLGGRALIEDCSIPVANNATVRNRCSIDSVCNTVDCITVAIRGIGQQGAIAYGQGTIYIEETATATCCRWFSLYSWYWCISSRQYDYWKYIRMEA